MNINKKASELANLIRSTDEFKNMKIKKQELEKNRSLKKQLDSYINKKNKIYSSYTFDEASIKVSELNKEYKDFFNIPIISNYMNATKEFNNTMENIYKFIEKELIK